MPGLLSLQKITVAIRMLAYGESSDIFYEYIRIGETTSNESLKRFCRAVVEVFGHEYLRKPNADDIQRLLAIGKERGFPGILGSIDCMHWRWKKCLTAWQVFSDLAQGRAPLAKYSINGQQYSVGYYLAEGIYPSWSTIVKTISQPKGEKNKYFAKEQEAARKDVERAFGVLQALFDIVRGPIRYHDKEDLKNTMMYKCVEIGRYYAEEEQTVLNNQQPTISHDSRNVLFASFIEVHRQIHNKALHFHLKENLVEHLWTRRGMID